MITRSLGISPGLPWGGPLPGGGYEGKTKRLDRAVHDAYDWPYPLADDEILARLLELNLARTAPPDSLV